MHLPIRPRSVLSGFRTLNVLIGLCVASSCGSLTAPEADLEDARERWRREGPTSYTMVLSRSCECLPEMSGPVEVVVENRAVTSRRYVGSAQPVPTTYAPLFLDVEGLFARIEEAIREGAVRVDVVYDAEYGFPLRIALDQDERIADDEITYEVSTFLPR